MDPEHPIYNESTRLQRLLEGLAAIPRIAPGSLRLAPSTAPHHSQPSSLGLGAEGQAADDCTAHYQVGHFGPESGLTPAQAAEANRLLARANRLRPIRGRNARERYARRLGGIKVAVLSGRTGNTRWGRSMLGKRGGRVMALYGLHILREQAPRGAEAAKAARTNKKAVAYWEKTGESLPLGQHETDQIPLAPAMDAWAAGRPFLLW